jgi:uncharacterized damage-inducible protein DinB
MKGGAMRELLEYRTSLIDRLVDAAHEFHTECLAAEDTHAPLAAGGWNIHQLAAHVRDVDQLAYGLRARRTAVEDNPEFQNFDGDAYMAEHYSASEPLNEILDGLVKHVESLAEMLRILPSEAWARESRHAMLGKGFTLQSWVEKDLAHIMEHLQSIKMQKDA